jgi:hypothetical protein
MSPKIAAESREVGVKASDISKIQSFVFDLGVGLIIVNCRGYNAFVGLTK